MDLWTALLIEFKACLLICFCQDCAEEAGTTINGGQTVLNPWCLIGGVATAVCQPNECIM